MAIRAFFPTLIYHRPLGAGGSGRFGRDLADECAALAVSDEAGQRWSANNYLGGYTSYGSHDRLHLVSSLFASLRRHIDPHVKAYARRLGYDLAGRSLDMSDCWVNVMPAGVVHSLHLHPGSVISGTYYVATPRGCPGLTFEDPRLSKFMAAPPRRADARPAQRTHVTYPAAAGNVILFESWLRHEVTANRVEAERISISFNFAWA